MKKVTLTFFQIDQSGIEWNIIFEVQNGAKALKNCQKLKIHFDNLVDDRRSQKSEK